MKKLLLSSWFDAAFPVMEMVFVWSLFGNPVVNRGNVSATFMERRDNSLNHHVDVLFALGEDEELVKMKRHLLGIGG